MRRCSVGEMALCLLLASCGDTGMSTGGLMGTGGFVPGGGGQQFGGGGQQLGGGAMDDGAADQAGTGALPAGTGGVVDGTGAAPGAGGEADTGGASGTGATGGGVEDLEPFSFFVTSLETMREQSGNQDGFGGNYGGLVGADAICQTAAAAVGFGAKTWRAFLSATDGGNGQPVHAIDRIGAGPWYDRSGRLVASDLQGLVSGDRPAGDAQTVDDLPNEFGQGLSQYGDTHDIVTGSDAQGQLKASSAAQTCNDWTSTTVDPSDGAGGFPGFGTGVQVGHSWPARSGQNWIEAHTEASCAAGVNLVQNGPGDGSSIGAGGGWGALYCFALQP